MLKKKLIKRVDHLYSLALLLCSVKSVALALTAHLFILSAACTDEKIYLSEKINSHSCSWHLERHSLQPKMTYLSAKINAHSCHFERRSHSFTNALLTCIPRSPLTWLVDTWIETTVVNADMTGAEMKLSRDPKKWLMVITQFSGFFVGTKKKVLSYNFVTNYVLINRGHEIKSDRSIANCAAKNEQ